MPSLDDITIPLEPGYGYHIFNRGNEGRLIFFQEKNYQYFLDKYQAYMSGYWITHAYCLLPNHFHLAIKVRHQNDIILAGRKHFSQVGKGFLKEHWPKNKNLDFPTPLYEKLSRQDYLQTHLSELEIIDFLQHLAIWSVSERFRRFLLGYAKAINVQEKRHGSLFQKLFRRKRIPPEFSKSLVAYIHRNPIHHAYCNDLESYAWSSYLSLLNKGASWLGKKEVMAQFEGQIGFINYHQNFVDDWRSLQTLYIEE